MMKIACLLMLLGLFWLEGFPQTPQPIRKAPAPLFRDPIYDGAADPVVVYNRGKKQWWMFYTQRRANVQAAEVAFCYGTSIGVAVTEDHGQSWSYHGPPRLEFEEGMNTFWAPDIFFDKGVYHMFVAYIRGARNNWGGKARIVHYISPDLWNWTFRDSLRLSSDNVIDPTFLKLPDGKWHIWYKDDRHSITMTGESSDLGHWKCSDAPAIGRPDDTPTGAHADVIVVGDKSYIFYFTHPGRKTHGAATLDKDGGYPYSEKRSSIQAAELAYRNGTLEAVRDEPFDFWLPDLN